MTKINNTALDLTTMASGADHEAFKKLVKVRPENPRSLKTILTSNIATRFGERVKEQHRWFKVADDKVLVFLKSGGTKLVLPNGSTDAVCKEADLGAVVELLKGAVADGFFDEQLEARQAVHDQKMARARETRSTK